MKIKTALMLAFLLPVMGMMAQGVEKGKGRWKSMNPEQKASSNANWMTQRLTLTETQKTQVKAANLEFYNSVKTAHDKYKGDSMKTQRKAALKTANETREAKLKTILTTDQYNKLTEIRKERKTKGKSEHPGKGEGKGKSEGKGDGKGKGKGGEGKAKEKTEDKKSGTGGTNDDDGGEGDDLDD